MPSLWIWLSLLYALQSSVSSDGGVSLNCNNTVEVKAGETVTLNCTIELKEGQQNCGVLTVNWTSTNDKNLCTNASLEHRYSCMSDNETYVLLTITNVTKEEDITVKMRAKCGMDDSPIKVKLTGMSPICNSTAEVKAVETVTPNCTIKGQSNQQNCESNTLHPKEDQERRENIKLALSVIFGVFAAAIVVVMLYLLFKTDRCRKIIKPADDRGSYSSTPQA